SQNAPSETEKRQRAQKMRTLNMLADGIAHDLSDLLHSAKIYLQMTQEDAPEDHVAQDYLDQTLNSLGEAETLVERLLALSRDSTSGVQEPVDLVKTVRDVLSLARSSFPSEFTLRTRFDDECTVVGDSAELQQLVADLVTNAAASMEGTWEEQPTVLDVSVRRVAADPDLADQYLNVEPGKYVHLAVSNTSEETAHGDAAATGTTTEVDEEDLYLSVARGIVDAHEGDMTVRDEPGEGTTFNVYLPLASDETPSTLEEGDASAQESGQHILVVDDDKTVRTLEGIRLSRFGHEVTTKADAHEALAAIQEAPNAFDVVLIDYHMPEMSGLELVHALRDEGSEASVVLMTGLSAQISESKARVVGIDHLLRKPVESHDLRELLARLE
ncbi:MAG: response regulator, partial [Salinibacter sp.]